MSGLGCFSSFELEGGFGGPGGTFSTIVFVPVPKKKTVVSIRSTPERPDGKIVPTAYQPVPLNMADWKVWCALLARASNTMMAGGQNTTLVEFTLDANADSTTLVDSRIGSTSHITFSPLSENAAHETLWTTSDGVGKVTVHHSNAATTDRKFRILIIA